ncbi:hypothetical protein A2W14_02425 [Candidatus Gottesmanbacteria bacterium RBG_16_37_8]|uniref:Uncharacterized protein n=1 Tax=Candidatus Gottesmanbacteria bacterium RBG_16_37_8 TaxID=1798371 RepID=A0A1F5YTC1_9BACT|nr:MAG: hypothetical protein A2W14_02425 [Candidatus Gottesmanbacteria bacterium RBG_16_37_8]
MSFYKYLEFKILPSKYKMMQEKSPETIRNYKSPDYILGLHPFERNQIGMHPFELNRYLPGFCEGRYMGNESEYLDRISILDKDVIRGVLFMNCESYQEMKEKVYQRIETMGKYYGIRSKFDIQGKKLVEEIGFSATDIINVLNFVERAMEGQFRRTNEPAFAHILRVVYRAIDFINYDARLYNGGLVVYPFTPETAKSLIIMSALHDFLEADKTLLDGSKAPYGDYKTIEVFSDGNIKDKIIFRRFGDVKNLDNGELEIKEKVSFMMDCDHRGHFINGLEALRSEGETEEQEFIRLRRYHDQKVEETLPYAGRYLMWYYLPFLVRIFDRRDNLDTYLISKRIKDNKEPLLHINADTDLEEFELGPPSFEEIIDKLKGTLENIGYSEQILINILSPQNVNWQNPQQYLQFVLGFIKTAIDLKDKNVRNYPLQPKRIKSGLYNPEVLKMLPSRIAAFYLFGLGQNDIYKNNPWNIKGPWFPTPI